MMRRTYQTMTHYTRTNMGKGCSPRPGHNAEKQSKNHDEIDWSKKLRDRKIIVRVNGKRVKD